MKNINKILVMFITIASLILLFVFRNFTIDRVLLSIFIFPVLIIPYLIDKYTNFKISYGYRTAYIAFIFLSYFLGSILYLYKNILLYDKFIHMLSGIFTSILALIILKNDKHTKLSIFNKILYVISFSMLVASLWEFFEYSIDFIFKLDTQKVLISGVNDTMQDMLVALVGSIIFIIVKYKEIKKV